MPLKLIKKAKFKSQQEFEQVLNLHENEERQSYIRGRSELSATSKKVKNRKIDCKKFPFYYAEYHCHFGEPRKSQSKGIRETK